MKIAVFGATGTVGKLVVEECLAKGAEVTAVARHPERLRQNDANLQRVVADVTVADERIQRAIEGCDAVIIALGDGMKGGVRHTGTQNIIDAMKVSGVRRLICQSTLGAGDSFDNLNWLWRFVFRVPLRRAMADHTRQERAVRDSGLDWTIVRPAAFTDGEKTQTYRHGFDRFAKQLTLKISRADVADFLVKQIHGREYLRQTPALSY
ncbi:MAG: SDR family oxidoreductase [Planctomycetota bacterium]